MSEISALPGAIVDWLNQQEPLSEIKFMTEFPAVKKAVPLRRAIVAVGIEKLEIVDSFSEDGQGNQIRNEYCREANINLRLAIHVPFSYGGDKCFEIFTTTLDCLTFGSNMNIVDSGCDDIKADRDTDAFVLNAKVNVKADFCPAASSNVSFASFINRELLCGSHIGNEEIHIVQSEREKWNTPFTVGQYFGNGATEKSINLNFSPSFVIAFAYEFPAGNYNSAVGTSASHFAVAVQNYGMMGIRLTANGFAVSSNSSYALDNCYPKMNEMGQMYSYIAFK